MARYVTRCQSVAWEIRSDRIGSDHDHDHDHDLPSLWSEWGGGRTDGG